MSWVVAAGFVAGCGSGLVLGILLAGWIYEHDLKAARNHLDRAADLRARVENIETERVR